MDKPSPSAPDSVPGQNSALSNRRKKSTGQAAPRTLNPWIFIIIAIMVVGSILIVRNRSTGDSGWEGYNALASELYALEVRKLILQTDDRNATTGDLDRKIASLKAKLAPLEPAHQAEAARRAVQERLLESQRQEQERLEAPRRAQEAQRWAQEDEEWRREQARKLEDGRREQARKQVAEFTRQAAEFTKRCEDIRSKRIADLTVNDLQTLKECGAPLPRGLALPLE